MKKRRGHSCRACGRVLPNEKFSGRGHRDHICKACASERRRLRRAAGTSSGPAPTPPKEPKGPKRTGPLRPGRAHARQTPSPERQDEIEAWFDDTSNDSPSNVAWDEIRRGSPEWNPYDAPSTEPPDEACRLALDAAVTAVVQEAENRPSPVGRGSVWSRIVKSFRRQGGCETALIHVVDQVIDDHLRRLRIAKLRELWLGTESGASAAETGMLMSAAELRRCLAPELVARVTDVASDQAHVDHRDDTRLSAPTWSIRRLSSVDEAQIDQLAAVLIDCVEGGASVSFMLPLTRDRAVSFWQAVARGVAAGQRALLVAEDAQGVCGTVQLVFDMPENQPHRADLAKMLVHRRARRQGLGEALVRAAEATARECGKTLLVLDAVTGGDAARMYERLGWVRVGDIPGYALMPQGGLCSTTVYYRDLVDRSRA